MNGDKTNCDFLRTTSALSSRRRGAFDAPAKTQPLGRSDDFAIVTARSVEEAMNGSFRLARVLFAVFAAILLAVAAMPLALVLALAAGPTIRLVVPFPTGGTTDTLTNIETAQFSDARVELY